jgi:hypothetical protein
MIPVHMYDDIIKYMRDKMNILEEGEFEQFILGYRPGKKIFRFVKDILNEITHGRISIRGRKNASGKI